MNPPTETAGLALNISAVEREAGSVQGCPADVGAPLRLSQTGARRQRGAPLFGRGSGEAPRDQAADGRRAAARARSSRTRSTSSTRWPKEEFRRAASRPRPRRRAKFSRSCRATMRRRCRTCSRISLMRQGLQRFVLETLTSLNHAVGDAWMRGDLAVFEEHLYTEQLQVALRTGINAFPRQTRRAAGAPHDVPRRAARPRPADGRGVARAGGRSVHLARRADADRGHPARGARA